VFVQQIRRNARAEHRQAGGSVTLLARTGRIPVLPEEPHIEPTEPGSHRERTAVRQDAPGGAELCPAARAHRRAARADGTTLRARAGVIVAVAAFTGAVAAGAPASRTTGAEWIVRSGSVRVVCPLTVGGSFEARTSEVSGSLIPGAATRPAGEFVVNLATLDTGIALRNEHMRERYLETGRGPAFAQAVLSGIDMTGLDVAALEGRGSFTGVLRLHGRTRPVAGRVELRRTGASVHVTAVFPVRLAQFDIATPRYLGVGVRDEVTVHVAFEAVP
jgi:polyisoprenoid-binding protein YceI